MALDTAPLIYFIEKHPAYISIVYPFFEAAERGDFQIVTSALTITEVLVHPFRNRNSELAGQYLRILSNARNLTTLAISPSIAAEAARIRAIYGSRTPDAIQLATALSGGATAFFTNDEGMASPPGLRLIQLKKLVI